jgi:peroxiredoxin
MKYSESGLLKLVILVGIASFFFFGCRKEPDRFSISGKISHAEGKVVYLEELLVSSSKVIDSTKINKEGEFEFEGTTSIPTYYLLKLNENKFITLLVDSLEEVFVQADIANFERDYSIKGSEGSIYVKMLNDKLFDTKHKLDSLKSLINLYRGEADFEIQKAQWEAESEKIKNEQVEFSKKFVMDNPFSMASVLALYQKFDNESFVLNDIQVMRVAASALNSIYPQSGHVKALYQNTVQLLQEQRSAKLQQFIKEHGDNSPDIILPDPEGKEIALSSLRGKIVLLQFWSAVDRNSRIMNQALVEAYNKYRTKGFEIYQVSIDTNRIEWIDAIDNDKLNWINVGDMEGSSHATMSYNVSSVPYNYLLNREGLIVAQNLKGPALDDAISRQFN